MAVELVAPTGPPTPPTEPLPIPDNLIATALSSTRILLSWDALPSNTGVTGYKVYRNGISTDNVTSSFSTLLYDDTTGLLPSTIYCYTVSAVNSAGLEGQPSVQNCATTFAGTSAPTASITSPTDGASFTVGESILFQGAGGVSYIWNFGDGGISTEQFSSHTYATANTYSVSLTVGGQHTKPILITVNPVVSNPTLTVNTNGGAGTGTVTSISGGIHCGTTCSAPFSPGTSVTLRAVASTGSTFTGWSKLSCLGTIPCTFLITGINR